MRRSTAVHCLEEIDSDDDPYPVVDEQGNPVRLIETIERKVSQVPQGPQVLEVRAVAESKGPLYEQLVRNPKYVMNPEPVCIRGVTDNYDTMADPIAEERPVAYKLIAPGPIEVLPDSWLLAPDGLTWEVTWDTGLTLHTPIRDCALRVQEAFDPLTPALLVGQAARRCWTA